MSWWSREALEPNDTISEDVQRRDFPLFSGSMRLLLEISDPTDIDTDFAHHQRLRVEFDRLDDELWCSAFNLFCNYGFDVTDEDNPHSNFTQSEGEEDSGTILNEFHPDGTMIHITNYYEITE